MDNEKQNDAMFKLLMRRLDNIEKNMANKSDVISAMLMVSTFAIIILVGTVVVLEALVGID